MLSFVLQLGYGIEYPVLTVERQVKPRRVDDATRIALVWLSRFFHWKSALVIVQPATLIRWHRQGFRWLWRWRSKPGGSLYIHSSAALHVPRC